MKPTYGHAIWLNGPPGSGKSRLQAALCADGWGEAISAEQIGQNLQAVIPVRDYQNLPAWPVHVSQAILGCPSGAVIDMTCISNRVRTAYRSIFAATGIHAVEIGLTARPVILKRRVLLRGGPGTAWCMSNLHRLHTGWVELAKPTIDTSTMHEKDVLQEAVQGLTGLTWPSF